MVAFVETLGGGRSPAAPTATPFQATSVPTPVGSVGDPGRGQMLYDANCAVRRRATVGRGGWGATLSTVFAAINPQAYARVAGRTRRAGHHDARLEPGRRRAVDDHDSWTTSQPM